MSASNTNQYNPLCGLRQRCCQNFPANRKSNFEGRLVGGGIRELCTGEAERQSVAPKWIDICLNLYVCRARGTLLFAIVDVWHVSELWVWSPLLYLCLCVCVCMCCYDNNSSNSCEAETVAGKMAAQYCQAEWMTEWMCEWASEWSAAVNEKSSCDVVPETWLDFHSFRLSKNERTTKEERERESLRASSWTVSTLIFAFCRLRMYSQLFKCQLQHQMAAALLNGLNRKPGQLIIN